VKGDKANQERHELTRVSGIGKTMDDPDPEIRIQIHNTGGLKVDKMLDMGNIQKLDKVKGDKANQERHELTRVSGIGKTMDDPDPEIRIHIHNTGRVGG
jgi:hypothetical protein